MNFVLDQKVIDKYPGIKIAFLICNSVIYKDESEKLKIEQEITNAVRNKYSKEDLEYHYLKSLYAIFYLSMGLDPKKLSTPLKQATRFLAADYKSINKSIDSCMKIEYLSGVSFQLYDIDLLSSSIIYDLAGKEMEIINFHNESKKCRVGELAMMSGNELVYSPTVGNNKKFLLKSDTQNVLVRILGIPGIKEEDWNFALNSAIKILNPIDKCILDKDNMVSQLLKIA